MAQSRIAQDGGFDYSSGDVGGTDRCGEDLTAETLPGHNGQSPDLTPRREDGHDPAPRHREADGRRTAADFGITEWTPYRRPWFRRTHVVVVIGAVAAIAVTAVVSILGRDDSATGGDATVAPAATTGGSPGPAALPPRSAGTPQTALLAPAAPPPAPTAEQMNPDPAPTYPRPRYRTPPHTKDPQPAAPAPPPMSFAPKPVTPPQTATPGSNGHHGFF